MRYTRSQCQDKISIQPIYPEISMKGCFLYVIFWTFDVTMIETYWHFLNSTWWLDNRLKLLVTLLLVTCLVCIRKKNKPTTDLVYVLKLLTYCISEILLWQIHQQCTFCVTSCILPSLSRNHLLPKPNGLFLPKRMHLTRSALHVLKSNSKQCPHTILQTLSKIHISKQFLLPTIELFGFKKGRGVIRKGLPT